MPLGVSITPASPPPHPTHLPFSPESQPALSLSLPQSAASPRKFKSTSSPELRSRSAPFFGPRLPRPASPSGKSRRLSPPAMALIFIPSRPSTAVHTALHSCEHSLRTGDSFGPLNCRRERTQHRQLHQTRACPTATAASS